MTNTHLLPEREEEKVFGIIGGGSTGPIILIELAKQLRKQNIQNLNGYVFHLIDPNGFCNGGIAYGQASDNHLKNSTRDEMSPWNKVAFQTHAAAHTGNPDITNFEQRKSYTPFLQKEYRTARAYLESLGVRFIDQKKEALIQKINGSNKVNITEPDGDIIVPNIPAENTMVCVGYGENKNFPKLQQYIGEGYVHSIYPAGQLLAELEKNKPESVIVVGNGPGLYDVANDLTAWQQKEKRPHPRLYSLSATGKPLDTRNTAIEAQEQNFKPIQLGSLGTNAQLEKAINALENDFKEALKSEFSLRRISLDIMNALGAATDQLTESIANAFTEAAEIPNIIHNATPVPEESQKVLQGFQPTFFAQRLHEDDVTKLSKGFAVRINGQTIQADCIINVTGHGKYNHPILQKMLDDGLISINKNLDVVRTDNSNYRAPESSIVVIGPCMHFGVHGIESFYKYINPMVTELVTKKMPAPTPPSYIPEQIYA